MAKQTRPTIQVLCDENTQFNIGSDVIRAKDLTLEQATLVDTQHPGRYVKIVNEKVAETEAKSE
jgi:hypothetical protein